MVATSLKMGTFAVSLSDNDLVPEEYQNRLIDWRDTLRKGYYEIGLIAATLIERAAYSGLKVTQARITEAVGAYCGKSGRTVRYYMETAVFFPEEVWQEFDFLPFAHFVTARYAGERWREVLEFSRDHPLISVEALEMRFKAPATSLPLVEKVLDGQPLSREEMSGLTSLQEDGLFDEPGTRSRRYRLLASVSAVEENLDYLMVELGPVCAASKLAARLKEVEASLRVIRDALPELLAAIEEDER